MLQPMMREGGAETLTVQTTLNSHTCNATKDGKTIVISVYGLVPSTITAGTPFVTVKDVNLKQSVTALGKNSSDLLIMNAANSGSDIKISCGSHNLSSNYVTSQIVGILN